MRQKRNRLYWLALVLALTATGLYVHRTGLLRRYDAHVELERSLEREAREVRALETTVESAAQRVEDLDADPLEIEAAIRQTMGHVREGEKVFRIETPSTNASE